MNLDIRTCPAAVELEQQLRQRIESGKISSKAIKDFLKKYYDGDPDCDGCPTGCKDPIQCYIDIHLALIDDSGIPQAFEMGYVRDGQHHCCGRPLQTLENGNEFCSVCGNEYGE